jgi:hypothetical protein
MVTDENAVWSDVKEADRKRNIGAPRFKSHGERIVF